MAEVAAAMKDSLVNLTFLAFEEWTNRPTMEYLLKYPCQSICCAAAIRFTNGVTHTLKSRGKLTVS